jgi:hypothetical protein
MPRVSTDNDPLYQGWVDNVKRLKKAKSNINRLINIEIKLSKTLPSGDIRQTDLEKISDLTKSAFLIYSSYTEANLLRLIHLPNSFESAEVKAIIKAKQNNIINGWFKAIQLASNKNNVSIVGGSTIAMCEQSLQGIINSYLRDPSLIRNKLAHGQWSTAYNRNCSSLNSNPMVEPNNLDIAKIDGWYLIFDKLAELLKQLIQSPNQGFAVQYSQLIQEINTIAIEVQSWNLITKRARLLKRGGIPQPVSQS